MTYYDRSDYSLKTDKEISLSANSIKVLKRRYLKRDGDGNVVESPSDLFRRVANNIAEAEKLYGADESFVETISDKFFDMMSSLKFLPNSPTLMNAGSDLQQLSACFVIPVEDSMESIFDAVKDTALIHKSGGGTGFSFSNLRPAGSRVRSTNGVSSGPVSFMRVFDSATESVKQGGTRRGANMGILRVDHPDIVMFIDCKQDNKSITNFNISVAVTEKFMEAVKRKEDYDLILPSSKEVVGRLNAGYVFDKIVKSAWSNGDPGIVFIDRINKDNPTPHIGEIESTNPCGEQPLLAYESCNLGSINLSKFYDKEQAKIDWDSLKYTVRLSVRFLDNVIDMNHYPIDKIDKMTKANRKIGLGVMGWADLLIMMSIPYTSESALDLASEIMKFIKEEAEAASLELAEDRGCYPNYKGSRHEREGKRLRNATLTTIAPTGTISIIAGCSSGIEPLFAISYVRNVMDNDKLIESHYLFEQEMKDLSLHFLQYGIDSKELIKRIAYKGHIEDEEEIPKAVRDKFITAHGVSPEGHIRMQAKFQEYTDNAVSKTVNFPNSATQKDVEHVYMLAYDLKVKGVTIYRDGSRDGQVLSTGKTNDKGKSESSDQASASADQAMPSDTKIGMQADMATESGIKKHGDTNKKSRIHVRPRPEVIFGSTHKINTGCGAMYVTINCDEEGNPFELFTQIGKAGGCAASQTESIGRLVSMALRSGLDITAIQQQLSGIYCHLPSWDKGMKVTSCADAIAKAIGFWQKIKDNDARLGITNRFVNHDIGSIKIDLDKGMNISNALCPECSGMLEFSEGCHKCHECGFSRC